MSHNELNTYVALLRALNISGKNKMQMVDLKAIFEKEGCLDVKTYIHSGNVVFNTTPELARTVASRVTDAIRKKFGYEVPVVIRSLEQMRLLVYSNPFDSDRDEKSPTSVVVASSSSSSTSIEKKIKKGKKTVSRSSSTTTTATATTKKDDRRVYVYFLGNEPDDDATSQIDANRSPPDEFVIRGDHVYLKMQSASKTKLSTNYFESKLATVTTARNWNTVTTVLKLMTTQAPEQRSSTSSLSSLSLSPSP